MFDRNFEQIIRKVIDMCWELMMSVGSSAASHCDFMMELMIIHF
jgi:hypothetical protein